MQAHYEIWECTYRQHTAKVLAKCLNTTKSQRAAASYAAQGKAEGSCDAAMASCHRILTALLTFGSTATCDFCYHPRMHCHCHSSWTMRASLTCETLLCITCCRACTLDACMGEEGGVGGGGGGGGGRRWQGHALLLLGFLRSLLVTVAVLPSLCLVLPLLSILLDGPSQAITILKLWLAGYSAPVAPQICLTFCGHCSWACMS